PKDARRILECGSSTESRAECPDGCNVGRKLLSLWSRRCHTGALGRHRRVAPVHFSFHRDGEHLGALARRVGGCRNGGSPSPKLGTGSADRSRGYHCPEQFVLASTATKP